MDFLGRIRKLDNSLQRGLDNGLARVFGGKVVPNELEECLKQEIDDFLMQDADGQYLAPNDFRIGVSREDFQNLSETEPRLPAQLADRMTRYCRNNGWTTAGSIVVHLQMVESLHTGQLKTASNFVEAPTEPSGYSSEDANAPLPADDPQTEAQEAQQPDGANPNRHPDSAHAVQAPGSAAPTPKSSANAFQAWSTSNEPDRAATSADYRPLPDGAAESAPAAGTAAAAGTSAADSYTDDWESEPFPTASRPAVAAPAENAGEPDAPAITLLLQDGSNRQFDVRLGSNIIGRGTASDFRLPDTGVSRQHAEITWDGNDAVLVDLHSTNGTIVNGEPIDNWLLADGDIISMGHSVMEVRIR